MEKHIDKVLKEEILLAVNNGERVSIVSAKHDISGATIYSWMKAQSDNTGTSSLKVAKLRKENQELKDIIGWFALDKKRAEKNTRST